MNALGQRVVDLIAATGPIPVSTYMALCLFDPAHGYYTTRDPIGRAGDFTTAPEISQMFGELVGAWIIEVWRRSGRPANPLFVEIGPGLGTLSKDIARTFDRLEPGLRSQSDHVLIETSPRLSQVQAATLASVDGKFHWATSVEDLPTDRPMFIVGNELFDAVPTRQFVKTNSGWRERCVGLANDGALAFVAGSGTIDPTMLPPDAAHAPAGAIFEAAPAREALMQSIAERIARDGGAGLFVDYGHLRAGLGDTFQAMRGQAFADPLHDPGEADLTTHVDFADLARVIRANGLTAQLATQGRFLIDLGLLERAGQLGANREAEAQERIRQDVERLAGPDQMGELFKVIGLARKTLELPGFARTP